jgi:orotate phosphoribosyltransferase
VAIGALTVLGQSAAKFAADKKLALESIASLPNEIWTPLECPLCARGIPLVDLLGPDAEGQPFIQGGRMRS